VAEAKKPPEDSATSKADAMALLEEAEAEAAEAEALAAAARARARAARLRREALTETEETEETEEAASAAETEETEERPSEADETDAVATVEQSGTGTDEDTAEETTAAAGEEPTPARRRLRFPSPSTILKVAAIVLIGVFAGVTGYIAWQDHGASQRTQRAANFVAGAKQGVINMTTLDFNRAKADVQRVIDSATGQFRDDFQQRAKDFETVVEQSKVSTQGTVNAAALESIDGDSAKVLVSATSKITNAAGAKDEPRVFRLRVTVTEDGGQYKMSRVDFVA
jgi:Mce-associated membrane protein